MDKTLIHLLEKVEKKYALGVQKEWMPDEVHAYRVAIRKTRTYLKFWSSDSKGTDRRLKNKLAFLQRQTALVREWDVFIDVFGEVIDEKSLEKGRFARLLLIDGFKSAAVFLNEIDRIASKMNGEPGNLREEKLRKQIFRESEAEYVDWHRLRIRIKSYRYTLEQESEIDKESLAILKEWQDLLGLIQDGLTNRKWFDWLGEQEAMVRHANEELLEENLRKAKTGLPVFIEKLQRQHP
jgi:CHAD domain-containing protein